ncbi:hypothetical protein ACP179_17325 [Xenorhabdus stockiae]|uniref:hypothetical protein n=1 Tax=Xenorhabdus stockiae TaxID=351614 RepID=UPI003CF7F1A7
MSGDICFQKCADVPQFSSPLQATGVLVRRFTLILTGGRSSVNRKRVAIASGGVKRCFLLFFRGVFSASLNTCLSKRNKNNFSSCLYPYYFMVIVVIISNKPLICILTRIKYLFLSGYIILGFGLKMCSLF